MISSVMRSVPLRIASVATAARSILSSPIVPSERVRSFAVRVVLPCRFDGYFSGMIFSNEASSCRNSSSVRHRGRIVGGNRFSTEETERMTRIISSVPRQTMEIRSSLARYRRALRKRFCLAAGADFGEIHFVEREDADLDFRQ